MKRINIIIIVLNVILISVFLLNNTLKNRITVIDIVKVLNETGINDELNSIKAQQEKILQQKVDTLMAEFQSELQKFEETQGNLNTKERENNVKILQNKQSQIQNYTLVQTEEIKKEHNELLKVKLENINRLIKKFAEKKNIEIILGANGSGNILYADKAKDITEIFLKYMKHNEED